MKKLIIGGMAMASAIMAGAADLTAKETAIVDIGAWTARGEQDKLGAADVELTDAEYAAINDALGGIAIYGDRDGKDIKKLGTVPENVDK